MVRIALCLVLLCAGVSGPAAASESALRVLFEREKSTLVSVPRARLMKMVSAPQSHSQDFDYSRAWLDSQPKPAGGPEWRCLAEALYFEARGETVKGQFAVAEVILNRVKSARFPGTLCDVIHQGTGRKYQCQFTYTCDGREEVIAEPKAFERVSKVARAILNGMAGDLTGGATHYHTVNVNPKWANVYTKTAEIGEHRFYRHNYQTASTE